MKTVLVTAARMPVALEICRALASCGARVIGADSFPIFLCQASNAVSRSVHLPSPRRDFPAYRRRLLEIIEAEKIELIIPSSEDVLWLAKLADEIGPACEVFSGPPALLQTAHHKQNFVELSARLGLPVPRSTLYRERNVLPIWCQRDYVLKQACSRAGQAVIFAQANSRPEDHGIQPDGRWLLQEKLDGETLCSCSIVHQGEVIAHLAYSPTVTLGSVGAVFRQVEQPAIRRWVKHFARATNWHGMVCFDFIVDEAGEVTAIECNPRATSGVHLFERRQLGLALLGRTPGASAPAPMRRAQVLMGMLSALPGVIARGPRRGEKLLDILRAREVTASWKDPLPFLHQFACYAYVIALARKSKCTLTTTLMDDVSWNDDLTVPPVRELRERRPRPQATTRRALPADNAALIELARACPMRGLLEIYSDRSPDFFSMNALQSSRFEIYLVENAESRPFGCAAYAEREGHWQGQQVRTLDMCDLRMDTRFRRSRAIAELVGIYARQLRSGRYHHGVCEILEGNHAAVNIQRLLGDDFAIHFDGFANFYQLLPVRKYRTPAEWHYRQATSADLPAIVELLRASHAEACGAPPFSIDWLQDILSRHDSFGIGHIWLAVAGDAQVVACVGLWDQAEIRRTVVTRFTPTIRRAIRLLDLLGRLIKLPPMPREGQALRYVFLRWPAAAPGRVTALAGLCRFVMNKVRDQGQYQFACIGFHENDALQTALQGMLKLRERTQLFSHWLKTSPAYRERQDRHGRHYVDLSLV